MFSFTQLQPTEKVRQMNIATSLVGGMFVVCVVCVVCESEWEVSMEYDGFSHFSFVALHIYP